MSISHIVMKRAGIGVRVHSGWGALVAVSGERGAEEIVRRQRVEIIDAKMAGAFQPYHFAKKLPNKKAEQFVARCATASAGLALKALRELLQQLNEHGYSVTGACILLSSGRPLPEFSKIRMR